VNRAFQKVQNQKYSNLFLSFEVFKKKVPDPENGFLKIERFRKVPDLESSSLKVGIKKAQSN